MIRINGKALWMTMFLAGTGVCASMVAGQQGFVDDSSHVPPSPGIYSTPQRASSIPGTSPTPSVTRPVPSTSVTTGDFGQGRLPTRQDRAVGTNAPTLQPGGIANTKVGPYGVGGRRPDPSRPVTAAHSHSEASNRVTPLGKVSTTGTVKQTGQSDDAVESGFSSPPPNQLQDTGPFLNFNRTPPPAPGMSYPSERFGAPQITGSRIGLLPGETATERSMRLMSRIGELEGHLGESEQRNAELLALTRQRDEQLLLAIREIKVARKEVTSARDELEHLRLQVKALQDKVQNAERDNAALLQTMAPLLQKLVEADGTNSVDDETQE